MARSATTITLRDVYRAVQDAELFSARNRAPNPLCAVGRQVQAALSDHLTRGERALENELSLTSIADILHDVTPQEASNKATVLAFYEAAINQKDADAALAFVDIFRLENGKIVEHWDVMQPIPDKMAHGNKML